MVYQSTYITKRKITIKECPWLDDDIEAGTEVHLHTGATYGCISEGGIAIKLIDDNHHPFYQIPEDSIR